MKIVSAAWEQAIGPLTIEQVAKVRGLYRNMFDARRKPRAYATTICALTAEERTFLYYQLVETYSEESSLAKVVKGYGINHLR